MSDLFAGQRIQPALPQAEVSLIPGWLEVSQAELQALVRSIPWHTEAIVMFGRKVTAPREICWIGDPDARYRYSGVDHAPTRWPDEVAAIRDRVAAEHNRRPRERGVENTRERLRIRRRR